MDLYWLEQTEADVPAGEEWLSAQEVLRLHAMPFARRRNDWRLGRWTAKNAWAAYLKLTPELQMLREIEIRPASTGAPKLFFRNAPTEVTIGLSHRSGTAICAVSSSGGALGCDLEVVEARSDAFLADYFTPEEQALVSRAPASDRSWLVALLWSAKESALKALGEGLRLDTRSVIVEAVDVLGQGSAAAERSPKGFSTEVESSSGFNGWRPLRVRHAGGETYQGWWRRTGILVRTMVASPPPGRPILLA
jgi:4'-phosphopantetheinyl transferase